jgi:hypothetical protein
MEDWSVFPWLLDIEEQYFQVIRASRTELHELLGKL